MFFFTSITLKTYRTWLHIWVTRRVSYKKQELPTLLKTRFLVGYMLVIYLAFYVALLCVLSFWVPWFDVRNDDHIKTMFSASVPPLLCRGECLIYVINYLFAYSCVRRVVFSPVLCTLCCQCLWIVLFWLSLRYSPTFTNSITKVNLVVFLILFLLL